MKRKTIIWPAIFLLIFLVAVGGAYYAFAIQTDATEKAMAEDEATTQTAIARRGDLIVFTSGTGELVAVDNVTLKFDQNGTLVELMVNVGDQVSAGEVLARLQVNKSAAQLAAEIAQAELALLKNQQALEDLYTEAEIAAAQALFELETAQKELADLLNTDLKVAQAMQAVAQAEEAVEDAEMMLYIYNSSPSDDAIYTAYASYLFKEKRLNELKDELAHLEYEFKQAQDKATRDRVQGQIDRTTAQMYNQQIEVEEARYRYETIDAPANPLDLNLAQTQMDTAQAQLAQAILTLAQAQQGAPAGEIALAEAKVAESQAEWKRWQDGPDPQEVILAETRLEASNLNLQLAHQESLIVDLIAPADSTVVEIHAAVNQTITGNRILTLADTSQPLIEVYLDETDFQSTQVGNQVEVIFDALPDEVFTGSIVKISPELESSFGAQVITALAVLDEVSYEDPIVLPLGLNAAVDVIAGETSNAVLVSIEALHEISPGNYIVYAQENDTFEAREVTVGLMDFTSAEITSGLEAGEVIALGMLETE